MPALPIGEISPISWAILAVLAAPPGDTARAQARDTQRGIEAVAQSAAMLGLLGTVVGMIEAFGRLVRSTGVAEPAELVGGIWTTLMTTALGLAIAILFYFLSLWLEARLTRERAALESLLAALSDPGPDPDPGRTGRLR